MILAIPWAVAHQAPLSMKFSKQEYWSGLAISFSRAPVGEIRIGGVKSKGAALDMFIIRVFLSL